jgi:protein-S-isoprenylcysteine O-methyltransferase Ste14
MLSNFFVYLPISHKMALPYSGLIIILLGMLLRFVSIRTPGRFFTVDIAVHKDQKIIKTGIYRYIRHPAYASSLMEFIGFGLSLNNWISLLVVIIPVTAAFIYRIKVEEELLKEKFGDEYSEYMNSTYRLFPWIY